MYNSLKKWVNENTDIQIKTWVSYTGEGDKVFDPTATDCKCYPVYAKKVIVDREGREHISNIQLFIDKGAVVAENDNIILDTIEYEIKSIDRYHRKGSNDLQVIYI